MTEPASPGEQLHIASLVVYAAPSRVAQVGATIHALVGAQVHAATESGKLIVTLEAESAPAMTATISQVQHIDGVLSAALVYQCADTLQAMNEEMPDAQAGLS